jgi:hypothetical protein
MNGDVEQPALLPDEDFRHPRDRFGKLPVVDQPQTTRAFGHEQIPVGQEGKAPRILQPLRDGDDPRRRLLGLLLCLDGGRRNETEGDATHQTS